MRGFAWVSGLGARVRSLLRGVFRRSQIEADMREEFRHHIEQRADDLVRGGLSWDEAVRQAHREFGHTETYRERGRAARGLRWVDELRFSWIDVKLGLRMLVKYPGLTLVAVFALALGIPVGLAPLHVSNAIEAPLPEDADGRIRAIRYWDPADQRVEAATYDEYDVWREELRAFVKLGAFRMSSYNVATDDGPAQPFAGAQVTATTFELLGTPPHLGRTLQPADEVPGAAAVVVVGDQLWRSRLGGDPNVVGRSIRIGSVPHTVVGVMPESFLFPVRQQLWIPLVREAALAPVRGLGLHVFGRLAEGISQEQAQAELSAIQPRISGSLPERFRRFQVEVVPFGFAAIHMPRQGLEGMIGFYFFQMLALVLLLVACANVAMLVYARTATRYREMAVRTALGASRVRIVSQIFVETVVLAVVAAAIGLITIDWILGRVHAAIVARGWELPYWLTLQVTGEAVAWALLLATVSAAIAGVVPAVRITGRKIQQNIQRATAGRSGIRFGGVTGTLIVADVAIAVTVLGFVLMLTDRLRDAARMDALVGIPAAEFLAAELRLTSGEAGGGAGQPGDERFRARLAVTQQRLLERLAEEPRVRRVTVANALPRMDYPSRRVEVESDATSGDIAGRWVRTATVDVDFFAALDQPILAGRGFTPGDLAGAATPVIVNTAFADRLMGGRNPIGRRVRFPTSEDDRTASWHEIVGMVGHLGMNMVNPAGVPGIYVPAAPGEIHPMQLAIHVGDAPESFAPRLREIVTEIDAAAILGTPVVLSRVYQGDWYILIAAGGGLVLLVVILVALAACGLYAMMSFSITERTREIGIRVALGARPRTLALTIVRRSVIQVAAGALIGLPLAARIVYAIREDGSYGSSAGMALWAAVILAGSVVGVIGLFACVAPVRRALRIPPGEALRAER